MMSIYWMCANAHVGEHTGMFEGRMLTLTFFPLFALHLSFGDRASLNSSIVAGLDGKLKGYTCLHPPGTAAMDMCYGIEPYEVLGIVTGNFLTNSLARPVFCYNHS